MTAAIEAAEAGSQVVLVEKSPYLGGRVATFGSYFPKLCPPYCGLEININRIKRNRRIKLLTSSEVTSLEGVEGDFRAQLRTSCRMVNEQCTACGHCSEACPVSIPDPFNMGMDRCKAAYLPHDLAYPFRYHIDKEGCLGPECGKCLEVCEYNAIDLEAEDSELEVICGSIILATGWEPYEASLINGFRFGEHPDVISNVMFERILATNGPTGGKLIRPSDGNRPTSIAFLQCTGSRDQNHLPYCSGVCCSASLKQAIQVVDNNPEVKIRIYYIDLRVTGRNEDFLQRANDHPNIELIKGRAGKVTLVDGSLVVEAENILAGKKLSDQSDLVVLATGVVPVIPDFIIKEGQREYANNGIMAPGIHAAGMVARPMDVSATVKSATGSAIKAIQSVRKN